MKKGIILEKHQEFMIVMTHDGLFQKASPIENASIGSEVYYRPLELMIRQSFFSRLKGFINMPTSIITAICLLLVLVIPFFYASDSSKTYAYVSVDINPSLSIEIDKEMYVNDIKPINEEATLIINNLLAMKGETLEDMLSEIINESEAEGLTKNGKNMIVGVSYAQTEHSETVDIKKMSLSSDWDVAELTIPEKIRETADEKHMSMNKIMLDSVEGNPEKIDKIDSKEREIIHIFYNDESDNLDSQSRVNPLNQNKEQKLKKDTLDKRDRTDTNPVNRVRKKQDPITEKTQKKEPSDSILKKKINERHPHHYFKKQEHHGDHSSNHNDK